MSAALDEPERVPEWGNRLRALALAPAERDQVREAVADPSALDSWLPDAPGRPPH
ncbi:hypothetical protein AB0K35_21070 [Micromonospora sp. NPDC053740]|uniref:hypothetical protein n=1 Tax=Micromonospora TaxID=1873 RepID=UPI001EE9A22B|nr:hypothetical protein [Micromonospora alfalfae]MCG5465064.1 hypothetical protein [Micromonospora alfalfae]